MLAIIPGVLSLLCAVSYSFASAPSINVDLRTSFPAPPFLLELIESAAAENSSCFFPILDAIASGTLTVHEVSQTQLYQSFRDLLYHDALISDLHTLASFDLSVATHASAPRIQAQFQHWRNRGSREVSDVHNLAIEGSCQGQQVRAEDTCAAHPAACGPDYAAHEVKPIDFDRRYGNRLQRPRLILSVDPTSPHFPTDYARWIRNHGDEGFWIRYKPAHEAATKALAVSGYGVELALKRTDYLVIDDREFRSTNAQAQTEETNARVVLDDKEVSDIRRLSASELRNLGANAASFIASSEQPLDTLLKVSQDFPKYSAALAHHNATAPFLHELHSNHDLNMLPASNAIWLNGQQILAPDVDVYTMQDLFRRERTLIQRLQARDLSPPEAIALLLQPTVAHALSDNRPPRYDSRDDLEGGNVIIWLNDLEKDKRYHEWPDTVGAYLQRMFPGQLPAVRKNAHTVIYPLDLNDVSDILDVVDSLQTFIKRTVPIRFGIVPHGTDGTSDIQARLLYHLNDAYGLSTMMRYLQLLLTGQQSQKPSIETFAQAIEGAPLRKSQDFMTFDELQTSATLEERADRAKQYIHRLSAGDARPPMFANGAPIPRTDEWMQPLSQQLSMDVRIIQQAVYEETVDDSSSLPDLYLNNSFMYRDPLLVPEDSKNVTLRDLGEVFTSHARVLEMLLPTPSNKGDDSAPLQLTNVFVIADFEDVQGIDLALNAAEFVASREDVQASFMHLPGLQSSRRYLRRESVAMVQDTLDRDRPGLSPQRKHDIGVYLTDALMGQVINSEDVQAAHVSLAHAFGVDVGARALIINGRSITPLPEGRSLSAKDISVAFEYERVKRIEPVERAMEALDLTRKMQDPLAIAKISSLLAASNVEQVPEGIFDSAPGPRTNLYDYWSTSETCITVGDKADATLEIVTTIDPSSETGQRWIPIINVLSQLAGVYTRIFLNPKQRLQDLPVKRFYRHVLQPKPSFDPEGGLLEQHAVFNGIPSNALLTMTLDVPPSWLVAPKESIHDLDNLRLTSLGDHDKITATYELENILIEGHTRDLTTGSPPRGAQLTLENQAGAEQAGTIIMANLGYFQFKANPGVYQLALKTGASDRIFQIDSAGTRGYESQLGDDATDILLASFKGSTVFPRLSRKMGMEREDVLESDVSSPPTMITQGVAVADDLLARAGLPHGHASEYVARGFKWGQEIFGMSGMSSMSGATVKHADINIFSVASGHLYERMLNIMMVSVMRHTSRTVKFWFIEQFLSPSFKAFLPTLASEYGFTFEMVTYKWPHWLRSQQEKQRTIWGYKILFLDVLFPLDLDKVIFVDADQIVRADMYDLVQHDLHGAPYGFTPMCDSRVEMEGFRFWKQGYWENFLRGKPYHISALYVVDLKRFRQMAAGDRLRQQYHSLSADPNSLSNLDQDLPNHMQHNLPIHSLPQDWLWCETWCSDESLQHARTIDLCNNPQTKEPKLDRARRQVPEWTVYDNEIAALAKRSKSGDDAFIMGVVGGLRMGEQEQAQRDAAQGKQEL